MQNDHLTDGDLVIVEKRREASNGETVVVQLEGRAAIKRYYMEDLGVRLQPPNGSGMPLVTKNPDIRGVVVGVVRKYNGS
jgi:repressor LexA